MNAPRRFPWLPKHSAPRLAGRAYLASVCAWLVGTWTAALQAAAPRPPPHSHNHEKNNGSHGSLRERGRRAAHSYRFSCNPPPTAQLPGLGRRCYCRLGASDPTVGAGAPLEALYADLHPAEERAKAVEACEQQPGHACTGTHEDPGAPVGESVVEALQGSLCRGWQ